MEDQNNEGRTEPVNGCEKDGHIQGINNRQLCKTSEEKLKIRNNTLSDRKTVMTALG